MDKQVFHLLSPHVSTMLDKDGRGGIGMQ